MSIDISSITLTPVEKRNLKNLKRGKKIGEEAVSALYHLGLSEPIYEQVPDDSVSIIGWKVSANGLRWLHYDFKQRIDKFWSRFFAVLAILISLAALLLELDDRGFLGGLFDGFRSSRNVVQDSIQSPSNQSESQ